MASRGVPAAPGSGSHKRNVHPVGTQAVAAALDAQSWLQQAQAAVKLPETRAPMRPRPSVLVAAVAILGGLTACGGATATPLRTEPSRPSAIANQTIPATPTRTATPAPTA